MPWLRAVRGALRRSMATRLLVGGLVFTIVLITGVSGLLLVSRNQETDSGALSNADNRAGVAQQLIDRVAEPQAQAAATSLAGLATVQTALAGRSPAATLDRAFDDSQFAAEPGLSVVVLDMSGTVLYTTECDTVNGAGAVSHPATATCEASASPHITSSAGSVREALAIARNSSNSSCDAQRSAIATAALSQCPAGVEGVEMLQQSSPAFDVAVPVFNAAGHSYAPLGAVVFTSLLRTEFDHLGPVIGYTPVFLEPGNSGAMLRFVGTTYTPVSGTATPSLLALTSHHSTTTAADAFIAHAIYNAPGVGAVAGSFVPLSAPGSDAVAGFVGVEVPLSLFAAGTEQDERTIAELSITALVVVAVLVLLFVDRFVRRPVARLEHGVERIASGDYTTDIPVTSVDELGRLATSVNRMRERIAGYVRHIDGSLDRLQDVSRALTTTTGGLERLQDAVLHAAAATVGGNATSMLFERRGNDLLAVRMHGGAAQRGLDPDSVRRIIAGASLHVDEPGHHVLAVPMFYQGQVTGSLLTITRVAVFESDQRTLETLANNAAVALENARLFEQQKQTVERLRELNQLKSDFLSTAQHELRTPVLAIQGQIELLTSAWERWEEADRLDIVRDMEISTRMLGDLVETLVDFSLLSADTITLHPTAVDVQQALHDATEQLRSHFKADLPVHLQTEVAQGLAVKADPARFRQVLRALLDNAVKFTPEGGSVSVRVTADYAAGRCHVDVVDTGIGIGREALPRIFDRFFQEDNSRTRRHGGMGLGLALVRRLCEAHGATISVTSAQGHGARFTLVWPMATGAEEPSSSAGFRQFSFPVGR
jgi:signal transduction histidine kinase